jgi:hypothetical protein
MLGSGRIGVGVGVVVVGWVVVCEFGVALEDGYGYGYMRDRCESQSRRRIHEKSIAEAGDKLWVVNCSGNNVCKFANEKLRNCRRESSVQ